MKAFTTATGVKPRVIVYYGRWLEPFQAGFETYATPVASQPAKIANPFARTRLYGLLRGSYGSTPSTQRTGVSPARNYHCVPPKRRNAPEGGIMNDRPLRITCLGVRPASSTPPNPGKFSEFPTFMKMESTLVVGSIPGRRMRASAEGAPA